jgi:hypothetical protein
VCAIARSSTTSTALIAANGDDSGAAVRMAPRRAVKRQWLGTENSATAPSFAVDC